MTRPRLFTPPLVPNARGLPRSTRGRELIRWARESGHPLWPWQEEAVLRGLEVDPETGLLRFRIFLVIVARQNGKTVVLRRGALWRLFTGARLVVAAAQDRSRALETWEEALEEIEAHPTLSARLGPVQRRTNRESFRVLDDQGRPAGRWLVKAATRSAGRGPTADMVPIDELREQTDWAGWAALSKTTMAGDNRQIWGFSNAGDARAVVLRHLRQVALAGTDPAIGIAEWSAPDGCALDDPRGWAHANPTLGRPGGITAAAIRTAMHSDPPEIFRTEVLSQFVDTMTHAVDPDAWRSSADPALDDPRSDWVMVVDVAPDGDHVAAVLAAVLSDGRVRVEPAGAWSTRAGQPATEQARRELPALREQVGPRLVGWFPAGPAKPLGSLLRGMDAKEIKGGGVSEACMTFASLVKARLVVHPDDPLITAHVTGAVPLPDGEGNWRFVRNGPGHVSAAYAAAGAVHLALAVPPPAPRERARIILPRRR